jgi:hypothetical protein
MIGNKTQQQVQAEYEALQKTIASLHNSSTRLSLLRQFQQKGVTRPDWTWFVAGNGR